MSQELYVVDLITKYGSFLDASVTRTFDTPMEEGLVLSAADQPEVGSEAADGLIPGHGHRWRRTGRHGGHEIVKPFVYREPQVAAKTRDQVFVVQQLARATEARPRGAVRAITPGVSSAFELFTGYTAPRRSPSHVEFTSPSMVPLTCLKDPHPSAARRSCSQLNYQSFPLPLRRGPFN